MCVFYKNKRAQTLCHTMGWNLLVVNGVHSCWFGTTGRLSLSPLSVSSLWFYSEEQTSSSKKKYSENKQKHVGASLNSPFCSTAQERGL